MPYMQSMTLKRMVIVRFQTMSTDRDAKA